MRHPYDLISIPPDKFDRLIEEMGDAALRTPINGEGFEPGDNIIEAQTGRMVGCDQIDPKGIRHCCLAAKFVPSD